MLLTIIKSFGMTGKLLTTEAFVFVAPLASLSTAAALSLLLPPFSAYV